MLFDGFKNMMDNIDSKRSILRSKSVLYVIFFICVYDLLDMLMSKNYYGIIGFIFSGILVSFFSKNMVVILLVAIVTSFILRNTANLKLKENFETEDIVLEDTDTAVAEPDTITDDAENDILVDNDDDEPAESDSTNDVYSSNNDFLGKKKKIQDENEYENDNENVYSEENFKEMMDEQNKMLEELKKYEPFINTIQNIAKNFGFDDEEMPIAEDEAEANAN